MSDALRDTLFATGGALRGPLWDALQAEGLAQPPLEAGERIGDYRILREIGRGGASIVYLAERADGAFHQQVALKLLRGDLGDVIGRQRFDQERQILATLSHPHIARLLDGGVDGRGRSYIVLEYLEGRPLDRYCDDHRLTVERRIDLFLSVARAVAYAHRQLIVHRDLKPGNIMVTEAGEVKLLDFGIAKLLDEAVAGPHLAPATRTWTRVLTPEYASPEQVQGRPVTIASDVYQLGLVLYELLCGRRACRLEEGSYLEVERVICGEEPPPPSSVATGARPTPEQHEAAAARSTSPIALARRLGGDLDTIVLACLRKEPDRRYASPQELVADLERWRAGEPVTARGESRSYRTAKFIRRHRLALTAAAAVLLSLLAGLTVAVEQARRARQEARKASEVRDFLVKVFEEADPRASRGEAVTARDLLDRGVARLDGLTGEPEVQAELLSVAGISYRGLGYYDAAQPLLERALRLQQQLHGPRSLPAAEVEFSLGLLSSRRTDYDAALAYHGAALATRRALLRRDDPLLVDSLFGVGGALMAKNRAPEAEAHMTEALALLRARPGDPGTQTAAILNQLGMLRHRAGDLDGAEANYREALRIRRASSGENHPETAVSLHNLAALLWRRGRLEEAETAFRQVLALEERLYGEGHATTADTWGYLGHVLRDKGDFLGAGRAYGRAFEIYGATQRKPHPGTANMLHALGDLEMRRGRPAAAEPILRRALQGRADALGDDHRRTREAAVSLGLCLVALGRVAEARPLLERGAGAPEEAAARARVALDALATASRSASARSSVRPLR
jgi:eukaryotic-like serine/threonine-protein kinase